MFRKYGNLVHEITYQHSLWPVAMMCMWHYTAATNCMDCYWHSSSANLHNWSMSYLRESHLWVDDLAVDLCESETGQHVH